jgi:hypothetical protein
LLLSSNYILLSHLFEVFQKLPDLHPQVDAFNPLHAFVGINLVDIGGQMVRAFLQIQDVGFLGFVKNDRRGYPMLVDFRVHLVNLGLHFIDRVFHDYYSLTWRNEAAISRRPARTRP